MRSQAIIQLILVGISLVIVFTMIRPLFAEIRADQDDMVRFRTALDTVGQFNARLAELRNRAESFSRADLRALEVYVPTSIDVLSVSRDIERIADVNQMLVQSITVAGQTDDEGVSRATPADPASAETDDGTAPSLAGEVSEDLVSKQFEFVGFGTYDQITNMLADLERNIYPLRLVSLTLTVDEAADIYQVVAILETYALPI